MVQNCSKFPNFHLPLQKARTPRQASSQLAPVGPALKAAPPLTWRLTRPSPPAAKAALAAVRDSGSRATSASGWEAWHKVMMEWWEGTGIMF